MGEGREEADGAGCYSCAIREEVFMCDGGRWRVMKVWGGCVDTEKGQGEDGLNVD